MARSFVAVTTPGLEAIAVAELKALGCRVGRVEHGSIFFEGSLQDAYRVNLWSRCLVRVRLELGRFRAGAFPELYNKAARLDWSAHLTPGRAVTVTATARRSRLNHTRRLAETVFAAMASKIAVEQAEHPSTGQHVHVHLDHDTATVGVDMSGERLHRRGYRQETGRAPLRENMAAALLQWAQWSGIEPLIDPMCGSGTFLIEGALMAAGRAPGLGHTFPFEAWPVLNAQAWVRLVEEAQAAEQHPLEGLPPLQGSDRSAAAIALAQRNAARARCLEALQLTCRPVAELTPPQKGPGVVVCNPPYGKRIGSVKALVPMYQALGRSLKRFEGWRTVVLTTRKALYDTMMAELGQQPAEQLRFQHGGLTVFASCVWVGDDIQAHRTAEDKEPS